MQRETKTTVQTRVIVPSHARRVIKNELAAAAAAAVLTTRPRDTYFIAYVLRAHLRKSNVRCTLVENTAGSEFRGKTILQNNHYCFDICFRELPLAWLWVVQKNPRYVFSDGT